MSNLTNITISQVPLASICEINGKKYQYFGQQMIKIGIGKVSQYVFHPLDKEQKPKFFNKTHDFKFTKKDNVFILQ